MQMTGSIATACTIRAKIELLRMIPVDALDLKILAALQEDGRLTNQQLADAAGLSASQCSRRRMRLEEEKVIAGYHAGPGAVEKYGAHSTTSRCGSLRAP